MSRNKIRVGIDFDGVVAYNPFRIIRQPVSVFKKRVLKINKLRFFVPKSYWQKRLWVLVHESSIFPGYGVDLLKDMARSKDYEFYLVTARFDFLKENLFRWLDKHNLKKLFKVIFVNEDCEQPHLFKYRIVSTKKFDYFIEDNLDIVNYLEPRVNSKICWIYNVIDRFVNKTQHGFPYLKEALKWIKLQKKTKS